MERGNVLIASAVGIGTAAIVLVLVLFIGAMVYTTIPLSEGRQNDSIITGATTNTWAALAYPNIKAGSQVVTNASTSVVVVNNTDYTMNYTDGTIVTKDTAILRAGSAAYVAYIYSYRPAVQSSTFNSLNTGIVLLGVGLIVAAALVILSLVMRVAGGRGKDGDGGW